MTTHADTIREARKLAERELMKIHIGDIHDHRLLVDETAALANATLAALDALEAELARFAYVRPLTDAEWNLLMREHDVVDEARRLSDSVGEINTTARLDAALKRYDAARAALAELVRLAEEAEAERDEAQRRELKEASFSMKQAVKLGEVELERDKLLAIQDAAERLMAALIEPNASEARRELRAALDAASGGVKKRLPE